MIDDFGRTSGTVVSSGTVNVMSGAVDVGTMLGSGTELVSSGGVAIGTQVLSGGFEVVTPGGAISGVTVSSGGILALVSNATATSTKAVLADALFGESGLGALIDAGEITVEGDRAALDAVFDHLDDFPLWFNIVQP